MAANAGFNKTSQNDLVGGINITMLAEGMGTQPRIYPEIALIGEPDKPTWRVAFNDVITVNTTLAEADAADFTSFTTSGQDITPAVYPVRSHISLELQQDAQDVDAVQKAIMDHLEVILNAVDANVLACISDATNTTDHNGASLDKTKFEAALLAFKKQSGRDSGEIIFVGSYRQVHELIVAYGNAGGTVFGVPGVASTAVASNPAEFFRGAVAGVGLFEGNVPASGGSDVSGALMVRRKALAVGFWVYADYKLTDPAGRVGVELMTWSRYGAKLVKQANLREIISLA